MLTFRCNFTILPQITFPDCRGVSYEEMVPEAPASAVSLLSQLVSRRGDISSWHGYFAKSRWQL